MSQCIKQCVLIQMIFFKMAMSKKKPKLDQYTLLMHCNINKILLQFVYLLQDIWRTKHFHSPQSQRKLMAVGRWRTGKKRFFKFHIIFVVNTLKYGKFFGHSIFNYRKKNFFLIFAVTFFKKKSDSQFWKFQFLPPRHFI